MLQVGSQWQQYAHTQPKLDFLKDRYDRKVGLRLFVQNHGGAIGPAPSTASSDRYGNLCGGFLRSPLNLKRLDLSTIV